MRIGLIPLSAKPYHAGHQAMVEKAAAENDQVKVFVSLSDRTRRGEFPIKGSDMSRIWDEHLIAIMPPNVDVEYPHIPVRKVYEMLIEADRTGDSEIIYTVYSDPEDTQANYPLANREKYFPTLYDEGLIQFSAEVDPSSMTRGIGTPDVSGTKVREYLTQKRPDLFIKSLPAGVDGQAIYDILIGSSSVEESLLKDFVFAVMG